MSNHNFSSINILSLSLSTTRNVTLPQPTVQFSHLAGFYVYFTLISLNCHPDLLDSVMTRKSEMAKLSRMECSFISALVKIVPLPGTVSSVSSYKILD